MAFIKNGHEIGDWVTTTKAHSCLIGTMTRGSRVKIIDIVQDDDEVWEPMIVLGYYSD